MGSDHKLRPEAGDTLIRWLRHLLPALALCAWPALAAELPATAQFRKDIQPILKEFCYDCHGDGAKKGDVAFDELKSDAALLNHDLWFKALKNVRAGLMPPQKKPRLSPAEQQKLEQWIKYSAFGIDPKNPDPGRVTLRRLNRVEYRNTVKDLMGIDFNTDVEFPPDDTGYGFDNIGDVLTISPMLLEKYVAAAKAIVSEAMPKVSRVIPEQVIGGNRFRNDGAGGSRGGAGGGRGRGNNGGQGMLSLPFSDQAAVATTAQAPYAGKYGLLVEVAVKGPFNFDPATCRLSFKADGQELLKHEFGWQDNKTYRFEFDQTWQRGDHSFAFDLQPLKPTDRPTNSLQMRIVSVTVRGPMDKQYWTKPPNYTRFFPRDVPEAAPARQQYARELLGAFAKKAFRRPVDDRTVDRLAGLAESISAQPGKTFEVGIAHATAAILASPRFLFRMEEVEANTPKDAPYANLDEYALASRLSYFLWSTMPDPELFSLAERGELRKNLAAQVKRMLADGRSERMTLNFAGQWLQTRDMDGITIDARAVFARDGSQDPPGAQPAQATIGIASTNLPAAGSTNALAQNNFAGRNNNNFAGRRGFGNRRFNQPRIELDRELRDAMRGETEMFFDYIVTENRPVTELLDCDYSFLNEKLAKAYAISNVLGAELRRVTFPAGSPRGGILTHGSVLIVTSNPDRTSPVKRGLFILSNVLGTPAPPPPGNVPALEVAEKDFKGHDPTLREALALHREAPLCASCHARMDPLGLAFENFNALGLWRAKERNQSIDSAGKLITGESFTTVRELKHILTTQRRGDFYRCLTEKLLTYALGRGLEYYDAETVDQLVQRLERENGRFLPLLMGIIESAPFQKQRTQSTATTAEASEPLRIDGGAKQLAETQTIP